MSRFSGPLSEFIDPADYRPAFVRDLVKVLGLQDASEAERRAAIEEWLRTNTPIPILAYDLAEHGYDVPVPYA